MQTRVVFCGTRIVGGVKKKEKKQLGETSTLAPRRLSFDEEDVVQAHTASPPPHDKLMAGTRARILFELSTILERFVVYILRAAPANPRDGVGFPTEHDGEVRFIVAESTLITTRELRYAFSRKIRKDEADRSNLGRSVGPIVVVGRHRCDRNLCLTERYWIIESRHFEAAHDSGTVLGRFALLSIKANRGRRKTAPWVHLEYPYYSIFSGSYFNVHPLRRPFLFCLIEAKDAPMQRIFDEACPSIA